MIETNMFQQLLYGCSRGGVLLRTFSSIKDLPVYDKNTGKEVGKVVDLCFDDRGIVKGLMVDSKGLLKKNKIIPLAQVFSFGKDGIMLSREPKPANHASESDSMQFLQNGHDRILGKPLVTTEGEKLGLVEDVYFREELGTIIGYEVTDGFFADMTEGRKVFKTNKPLTIGENILIVDLHEANSRSGESTHDEMPKLCQ